MYMYFYIFVGTAVIVIVKIAERLMYFLFLLGLLPPGRGCMNLAGGIYKSCCIIIIIIIVL